MRILAGATAALRRIVDLGLAFLIIVVLFAIVLGKGAPLVGRQTIVIGGGSMEPALGLGSAIVVAPVDPAALAVGDIVSMRVGPEQTTFTHRIVAVVDRADGRWIRTKGDANATPDPTLVPASAIIGRVELALPYAGYLLALLSLPMGVMFVLGLAATLLAVAWLLESLELEPRPARHAATAAGQPARTFQPIDAGEPAGPVALHPEPPQGEPIAARSMPIPVAGASAPFEHTVPAGRDSPWPDRGPARPVAPGPAGRPTIRQQLATSREIRHRRAHWLERGRHRPAAD